MDDMHSIIQQGMAYRVKYRVDPFNPKRKYALQSLGVHMLNRGLRAIFPNGTDVKNLGVKLIGAFDHAEANHNGVAVEEVPASVQAKALGDFRDPITQEPYEGIGHYNLASCKGAEYR